ncbi:NUDIX hydrolase [Halosimplex aquaticum]|uniref:NUDIX hydrolase n=1 Tax=Halosimplex aquaticum TaxID=3026162 RepID=A0ABD5YBC0_9EURY|nr:NUDIX hydrolase [Halosimplex aquaticum]
MQVTDPRERSGDLYVSESSAPLPPDDFAEAAESEAVTAGWVVTAFAFDDDGRVLLIEQPWADGWICPGGALKPDESLAEGATRELREETGVNIDPIAPRGVDEFSFVNEETGETIGWTLVVFEAVAESAELGDDLGLDGEEITDARWFDGLPDDVYNPDLFEPVYERCENSR